MAAALRRALGSAAAAAAAAAAEEEEEEEEAEAAPPGPVLVLGPAGSGRTALLLRVALAGGPHGPRALYLAPSAPPGLPGRGGDPRALQRLELRYPPSAAALARELAALPSHPRPPGLVLLDGLEQYLGGSPGSPARLAALVLEVARSPAQVVAALRLPPPSPRRLHALRRFFPAECRLRPPGSPTRPGTLRVTRPGTPPQRWTLRFGSRGWLRAHCDGDIDGDGDNDGDGDIDSDGETDSDGDTNPQSPQTPGWGH